MMQPIPKIVNGSHYVGATAFTKIGLLVVTGFACASLAMVLLVSISGYSATQSTNASAKVEQGEQLSHVLEQLVIDILRAEVLRSNAGQQQALDHPAEVLDDAPAALAAALRSVSDDLRRFDEAVMLRSDLRERAARLRLLVQAYLSASADALVPAGSTAPDETIEKSQPAARGSLVARLHAAIAGMVDDQARGLKQLREEEHRSDRLLQACYLLIATIMIATFIALCRHIWRNLRLQDQLRRVASAAQQQLELRVQARTAELQTLTLRLEVENRERAQAEAKLKEYQETIRRLLAHQESRTEQERKRIAREIHDGLAQDIYVMRMDLCRFQQKVGYRRPRLAGAVKESLDQIDRLLANVRSLINNLRPEVLDLGLVAALRWHLSEFERRTGHSCWFFSNVEHVEVDEKLGITLFRILQEATANVVRHANATRVSVELLLDEGELALLVSDDGIGFDPAAKRKTDCFGLLGIIERTAAVAGKVDIVSNRPVGTTLEIRVSLPTPDGTEGSA